MRFGPDAKEGVIACFRQWRVSGWAHFARMPRPRPAAAEMTGEKSRDSIPIYSIARRARSSSLVKLIKSLQTNMICVHRVCCLCTISSHESM